MALSSFDFACVLMANADLMRMCLLQELFQDLLDD